MKPKLSESSIEYLETLTENAVLNRRIEFLTLKIKADGFSQDISNEITYLKGIIENETRKRI